MADFSFPQIVYRIVVSRMALSSAALLAAFSELELNGSSSDRCMQPRSRPLPFRFWHICTGPFFCEPLAAPAECQMRFGEGP